jgi:hypothetical protein
MARSRPPAGVDPELQRIDDLERRIISAHDERIALGAPGEEIEQQRPAVAALAIAVCDQLRAEYRARR